MIPQGAEIFSMDISAAAAPSESFKLDQENGVIRGSVDGIEAVRQAVFKILNTERYRYPIYSWDYGVEISDLLGQPFDYVCAELERRIGEALVCDDRISGVDGFEFERQKGGAVLARFVVRSVFGSFDSAMEAVV